MHICPEENDEILLLAWCKKEAAMRTIPYIHIADIFIAADNEWAAKNLDPVTHPPFAQQAEFEIAVGEEITKITGCTRWWKDGAPSDTSDIEAPAVEEFVPEPTAKAIEFLREFKNRVRVAHERFMEEKRCHICSVDEFKQSHGAWSDVLVCFCDELDQ